MKCVLILLVFYAAAALPDSAIAAPAFVQSSYATPQTAQSTVTAKFTAMQAAGNTSIVAVGFNDTYSSISSVTDSNGNVYKVAVPLFRGRTASQAIYYAPNIKAGMNTVTVKFNRPAKYVDLRIVEYSGLDSFDAGNSARGSTSRASSGSVTTSQAGDLLFAAGITSRGFSSAGSGYTLRMLTTPDADIVEDKIAGPAGTYSATARVTGYYVMQVAAFKASTGTTPVVVTPAPPPPVVQPPTTTPPPVTTPTAGDPASFISYFVSRAANWDDPSIIGGKPWYNHHGGMPYSLEKLDDYTLRMEVRQGDPEAIDVGGERSEIASGFDIKPTDLMDIEFDYVLEPGAPFVIGEGDLAWATILQVHGDVRPCWIGFEGAESIYLAVNADVNYDYREWHYNKPLVRGQTYHFRLQLKRSPTTPDGYVRLYMDGALVADFSNLRVSGTDNYFKLGIYRGWNGLIPQTTSVRYSNILVH